MAVFVRCRGAEEEVPRRKLSDELSLGSLCREHAARDDATAETATMRAFGRLGLYTEDYCWRFSMMSGEGSA
jgi:hypothetical protein